MSAREGLFDGYVENADASVSSLESSNFRPQDLSARVSNAEAELLFCFSMTTLGNTGQHHWSVFSSFLKFIGEKKLGCRTPQRQPPSSEPPAAPKKVQSAWIL